MCSLDLYKKHIYRLSTSITQSDAYIPCNSSCETLPRRAQENGQSSWHIRARGHLEKLLAPVENPFPRRFVKNTDFIRKSRPAFKVKALIPSHQPSSALCSFKLHFIQFLRQCSLNTTPLNGFSGSWKNLKGYNSVIICFKLICSFFVCVVHKRRRFKECSCIFWKPQANSIKKNITQIVLTICAIFHGFRSNKTTLCDEQAEV